MMVRKIFACVEFQKKPNVSFKNFKILNCSTLCKLFPCEVVTNIYQYPLKIMIPAAAADGYCQWLYPITFGGGLVEGDNITITLEIGANCSILITSLSFPKVYCCENEIESQQHWKFNIESGSLVCVLPDPLVCYKQASYVQTQNFNLAPDANLVLLDWFTSGRSARGERWSFSKLKSVSSIFIDGQLAFKEAQNIQSTSLINVNRAMKSYNIIGTCMVIGPSLESLTEHILFEIGKCKQYGEKANKAFLFATSPLYLNESSKICGCVVRFAAESVSDAVKKIEELLLPLYAVLGENPFLHK